MKYIAAFFVATTLLIFTQGCDKQRNLDINDYDPVKVSPGEFIPPLQVNKTLNPRIVQLGGQLFHDPRLSHNDTISCAHCHKLNLGGTDNLAVSIGIDAQVGSLNSPSVLNSGHNFSQFWDGRASTLEEQINGPILNPIEMNTNWKTVVRKLSRDPGYRKKFNSLFEDGITAENIRIAIATFERSLDTPSPFDAYLLGDERAINRDAKQGFQRFKDLGCISCHHGINIGGNLYQKLGVIGDYFEDRGGVSKSDYGRFNVTGDESDKFKFKVPSLRNVAKTAPYFHDGQTQTLDEAIWIMGYYQLGVKLSEEDIELIEAFLVTLTGELPEHIRNRQK